MVAVDTLNVVLMFGNHGVMIGISSSVVCVSFHCLNRGLPYV